MKLSTIFTFVCTAALSISQAVPGADIKKRDLGDDITEVLEKALQAGTCGACNTALAALKVVALLGDKPLSMPCSVLALSSAYSGVMKMSALERSGLSDRSLHMICGR